MPLNDSPNDAKPRKSSATTVHVASDGVRAVVYQERSGKRYPVSKAYTPNEAEFFAIGFAAKAEWEYKGIEQVKPEKIDTLIAITTL